MNMQLGSVLTGIGYPHHPDQVSYLLSFIETSQYGELYYIQAISYPDLVSYLSQLSKLVNQENYILTSSYFKRFFVSVS